MFRYIYNLFIAAPVCHLDMIHGDIIVLIFSWLSHDHLARMCQVAKRYQMIVGQMVDRDKSDFLTCCEQGRYLSMWRHLSTSKVDLNDGLIAACRGGQYTVVWLLLHGCRHDPAPSYIKSPPWLMIGHLCIPDEALSLVCASGHLRIVKLLVEHWGWTLYPYTISLGLECACRHGHQNVVDYLIRTNILKGVDREVLKAACKGEHLSIIRMLADWDRTIPNEWWIRLAIKSSNSDVIAFCKQKATETNCD